MRFLFQDTALLPSPAPIPAPFRLPPHSRPRQPSALSCPHFALWSSSVVRMRQSSDASAIIHTASPFHQKALHPNDFISPAVSGTQSILSAASLSSRIHRVIITSSYAAIFEFLDPGTKKTFTEQDWNQQAVDAVAREGDKAWKRHWYRASKVLAEREAWKFVEEERPGWDLVTICPTYTLGPGIQEAAGREGLNTCEYVWVGRRMGKGESDGRADDSRGDLVLVPPRRKDDRRRPR